MNSRPKKLARTTYVLFWAGILFMLNTAPARSAQPSSVTIQYVNPEKFTDFRIYGRDAQWSASYFASQISDYLSPALSRRVPGAQLTLRFTDIDLAGREANPSRGGRNVRVNRGTIAPARMSFIFLLKDSGGRTLASGSTRITDTSNPSSTIARQRSASEALYYEKQMLDKWLKSVKTS